MNEAFFSKENHQAWNGRGTNEFPNAATGRMEFVNYMGSKIDGFPGFVNGEGQIVRPPNFESYVHIGELQQGKIYPPDISPEVDQRTSTFRLNMAIFNKNLAGVKEAILDGADVNAPHAPYNNDPIWIAHMDFHGYDKQNKTKQPTMQFTS